MAPLPRTLIGKALSGVCQATRGSAGERHRENRPPRDPLDPDVRTRGSTSAAAPARNEIQNESNKLAGGRASISGGRILRVASRKSCSGQVVAARGVGGGRFFRNGAKT